MLERLHVRPELAAFETAIRERVERLSMFEDPHFARTYSTERAPNGELTVVSEFIAGIRLADLLESALEETVVPGVDAALGYLAESLSALSALHRTAGFPHGLIAPDRIVFTAEGRLLFLDAPYAAVVDRLGLSRRRLWTDLGIAVAPGSGPAHLDVVGDLSQTSLVAVMLILGRRLDEADYPDNLPSLLMEVVEVAQIRGTSPFATGLQRLFQRLLPLPGRRPYASADEALGDLRQLLRREIGVDACQNALLQFIRQLHPSQSSSLIVPDDELALDELDESFSADDESDEEAIEFELDLDEHVEPRSARPQKAARQAKLDEEDFYELNPEDLKFSEFAVTRPAPVVAIAAVPPTIEEAPREVAANDPIPLVQPVEQPAPVVDPAAAPAPVSSIADAIVPEVAVDSEVGVEVLPSAAIQSGLGESVPAAAPEAREPLTETVPVVERTAPIESAVEAAAPVVDAAERKDPASPLLNDLAAAEPAEAPPSPVPAPALSVAVTAESTIPEPIIEAAPFLNVARPIEPVVEPGPLEAIAVPIPALVAPQTPEPIVEAAPAEPTSSKGANHRRKRQQQKSARARKDKLRSTTSKADTVATQPTPAQAAAPKQPPAPAPSKSGWLIPAEKSTKFEAAPLEVVPAFQAAPVQPMPAAAEPAPPVFAAPQPVVSYQPPVSLMPPAPALPPLPARGVPMPRFGTPAVGRPTTPPPTPATPMAVPAMEPVTRLSTVKIKAEPPAGYVPTPKPRRSRGNAAEAVEPVMPLPGAFRGPNFQPDEPSRSFPWKLVVAVVVIVAAAIFGGRAYLPGGALNKPPTEAAPVTLPPAEPEPQSNEPLPPDAGQIVVKTEPAGARVLLDGKPAGESPVTLVATPGRHVLTFVSSSGSVRRTVKVVSGKSMSVEVPIFSGWVSVIAPFVVDVAEDGKSLGTTEHGRIMLAPGRHHLVLTNGDLAYRSEQDVTVTAEEVRSIHVEASGKANINAIPWAEVWSDGRKLGDTPIANYTLPLGSQEFLFKHPQFGERKVNTTIRAGQPATVSVDFTKPQQP